MRSISLDTETTGQSWEEGHKLIELGCVEMWDGVRTGEQFHVYINPEREVSDGARRVHGMSLRDLVDKPLFKDVVDDFLAFIGNDLLVIHNAEFDLGFINSEMAQLGLPALRNPVYDTYIEARKRWPGARAGLDALCRRFSVDNSGRQLHGALLDADLLAQVYLEMNGGAAPTFDFQSREEQRQQDTSRSLAGDFQASRWPRRPAITPHPSEVEAYNEFIKSIIK